MGEADVVKSSLNLVNGKGEAQLCRIKLEVFSTTSTNEPKELLLSAICG